MPPVYSVIRGVFSVVGRRPDGDSLGFFPDDRDRLKTLPGGYRLRSNDAGTVQIRLEGIDAPEMHYNNFDQPHAALSRDTLLQYLGYERVTFDRQDDMLVTLADPPVKGSILTHGADANGRIVAYVLPEPLDCDTIEVDDALLDRTVNLHLIDTGAVYSTVYTSMPVEHRQHIQERAKIAREAGLGIWPHDRTGSFTLRTPQSLGASGQLILPKLFRRALSYLRDKRRRDTLPEWLQRADHRRQARNDRILLPSGEWTRLAELLEQEGVRVRLIVDVIDLVFEEIKLHGAIVQEGS